MIATHAVLPYQIEGVAIEKVRVNYSYGSCYDCQEPSLPKNFTVKSMQHPPKFTCPEITFTFKDHHTVYFDFDRATLRNDEKKKLAEWLKKLPKGTRFTVVGYTDRLGSKTYNKLLAEKRAQAVAGFLKKMFPNSQVEVKAEGKCCYRSQKNCLNRRVEIKAERKFTYKPKLEVSSWK